MAENDQQFEDAEEVGEIVIKADDALANAKQVKGIWFPKHDKHLSGMVEKHSKIGDVTLKDGRVVGTYQKHKMDFAMRQAVAADRRRVAIDIGAHVGLWSMHLAELFKRVEAFEPLTLHQKLFALNVPNGNVNLHPVGLGDMHGTARIVLDHLNTGNAHVIGDDADELNDVAHKERRRLGIKTDAPVETETVEIAPLDDWNFEGVDLIKIDVEGYELPVVRGARETILSNKPVVIVEQKGNDTKFRGETRNSAGQYLRDIGMTLIQDYGGDWIMGWPK